jgi:hypothetical protein
MAWNGFGYALSAGEILRLKGLPGRWCWEGAERASDPESEGQRTLMVAVLPGMDAAQIQFF